MDKVFEDEFMDLQAGLISLCLEVTKRQVDKIYAYGSNEKKSKMFNVFVEASGEVKYLNQIGVPKELIIRFLDICLDDLENLDAIGKKYNRPVPTELKLYYDVREGKFNAEYKYEEICSARTGKAAEDVFRDWVSEVKAQLQN